MALQQKSTLQSTKKEKRHKQVKVQIEQLEVAHCMKFKLISKDYVGCQMETSKQIPLCEQSRNQLYSLPQKSETERSYLIESQFVNAIRQGFPWILMQALSDESSGEVTMRRCGTTRSAAAEVALCCVWVSQREP